MFRVLFFVSLSFGRIFVLNRRIFVADDLWSIVTNLLHKQDVSLVEVNHEIRLLGWGVSHIIVELRKTFLTRELLPQSYFIGLKRHKVTDSEHVGKININFWCLRNKLCVLNLKES